MSLDMVFFISGILLLFYSGVPCVRAFSWSSPSRLVEEPAAIQCPSDYDLHGSTCLKMSKAFTSYATAEVSCHNIGGRLAAPVDLETHAALVELAKATKTAAYWIGLKKVNDRWVFSDGTPVSNSFTLWHSNQPIIGKDFNCGLMLKQASHAWVSSECDWGRRYVCQYEPVGLRTTPTNPAPPPPLTWTSDSVTDSTITARPPHVKKGCELSDLKSENLDARARPYPSTYNVGSVLPAVCRRGYASRSPVTVECMHTNAWRVRSPCLKTCPRPTPPSNTLIAALDSISSRAFLTGDLVSLSCPSRLVLEGEGRLECAADGTWSTGSRGSICVPPKPVVPDRPGNEIDGSTDCSQRDPRSDVTYDPLSTVDNEFVKVGQSTSLSCRQYARIEPRSVRKEMSEWTWMKEQDILEAGPKMTRKYPHLKIDERGSLLVLNMSRDLVGLYTCVSTMVDNDDDDDDALSRVTFRSVYVALATNCSMSLNVRPQDTVVLDGGYVLFRCYADDATIVWSKGGSGSGDDDQRLIEDDDHKVLPNGALLITNARPADTGTYRCQAQHVSTRCRVSHSASLEVESSVDTLCGRTTAKTGNGGVSSVEDRGKIVGGEEVERGSHPWLALIAGEIPRPNRGRSSKVFCGGSLVNNYWVLTAAHCLRALKREEDASHLKVMLGKHDRTITEPDERIFGVLRAVVHPHFDEDSFDNDVAMLRLDQRVYYSNYIVPICLPPTKFMSQFAPIHLSAATGFVVGWGQLTEAGLQPSELRAVRLPLLGDETCRRSTSAIVTDNMFCAGYNLTTGDACKGDSGGPFEMSVDGRTYVAGIVSWGEGCARPAKYGFYTKVEVYVQHFIHKLWNE